MKFLFTVLLLLALVAPQVTSCGASKAFGQKIMQSALVGSALGAVHGAVYSLIEKHYLGGISLLGWFSEAISRNCLLDTVIDEAESLKAPINKDVARYTAWATAWLIYLVLCNDHLHARRARLQ